MSESTPWESGVTQLLKRCGIGVAKSESKSQVSPECNLFLGQLALSED